MTTVDTNYVTDTDHLLKNPERGMYFGSTPNTPEEFHTIVPKWLWLAPVCNVNLTWNGLNQAGTSPVLNAYATKLEDARRDGYKILFRPRYDKETGGRASDCMINGANVFHADTMARQKNHIDAVAAMLGDYKDVIAFIQAGYLGNWGEWNTAGGYARSERAAALQHSRSQRDHRPRSRGVRCGRHRAGRRATYGRCSRRKWSSRNASANVGLHNDCFMSSERQQQQRRRHLLGLPRQPTRTSEATALARAWAQDVDRELELRRRDVSRSTDRLGALASRAAT